MKKIDTASPDAQSADLVTANIEQLKALFPELITEGAGGVAVNVDVLKALVGDASVTDADEKYGLNWHGKRRARQLALTPSTGTLRPCPEDSVDWDTTQNLLIEGDNLEVLKLLQKSYAGKVKLIYIDPPYNTGKDFVYPDNFQENIKNYLELTGQIEGRQKISSNTEASGRFHTDWLNMMYPRLKLARNLLREDGFIFVSIDDNEVTNLRAVLDDLFGSENFVASVIWQKKYSTKADSKDFSESHDFLLCYRKSDEAHIQGLPRSDAQEATYKNSDNDPRGPWASDNLLRTEVREYAIFAVVAPNGQEHWPPEGSSWRFNKERMTELIADDRIWFGEAGNSKPRLKRFRSEVRDAIPPQTIWTFEQVGHTDEGTKQLAELFGSTRSPFPNPKPTRLLQRVVQVGSNNDDIIVDFFAGSGTIGQAVWEQNVTDGASRRFIVVQLPEPLSDENKEDQSAIHFCEQLGTPHTIAELTKERLRRAGAKVKADTPLFVGDIGFRVFKLDTSNIRAWNPKPDDLEATLLDHQEHLLEGRSEADVLYELLLKLGLDLCVPIEQRNIEGLHVHAIGGGVLLACLAETITREQIEAIAQGIIAWHKELAPAGPAGKESTCVFRDSAFADDVAKTNLAAILEQHGIQNVRSL
ncbi:site-specific DNA-methyltransferase [Alcaligenes ammonioxydans]|uniref:site-specific DNA-methyltransferase n=1 Tax=Alcaligenes ammonioxydans TaxID=2582914 RepID=UPI003D2353C7